MTTSSTTFMKIPLMINSRWVVALLIAICSMGFCEQKSAKGEWEAIDVIALDFSNEKFWAPTAIVFSSCLREGMGLPVCSFMKHALP